MMRAAAGPSRSSDWLTDWLIDWSIYFLHFIRSFHSSKAILRSSSVQDKKVKTDNPNVNNNSKQLALAARSYQIILRRPSFVVIDVGPLRKVRGGHFWNIRHGESLAVPSLLWLWMKNDFCKKRNNARANGKVINGGSRERALGGAKFQRGTQILKINRISLAYNLTSNKKETFTSKSCFVFLLYRVICWFYAIFGRFGGMVTFGPEGHGSPPPVNTWKCIRI